MSSTMDSVNMGNPVYVPCHELPEEVEWVECSIDDVGKKICDAGYLTEKEFICGTVDDMFSLGGGIAIAPKVVNVIDATVDQNKKMLVQTQYVNFIQGKRPISEGSSSESLISFCDADLEGIDHFHNDSLVISLNVGGFLVDRIRLVDKILVDPGSAVNVMYINLFDKLNLKLHLRSTSTVLNGFNNSSVQPIGEVMLPIYLEPVTVYTPFLVIDVSSTYNAIVGRPWLHKMKAVPSTFHQLLKFPPSSGIEAIRGDLKASQQCYMIEAKAKEKAAKIVAASGVADGCMRSDSGPVSVFNFAKFAEDVEELDYLVGAVSNPKKPFAAIVGGSKVSSKIGVIESLLEKVDMLLLGGGMIFTFYKAQGYSVGSSLVEEDELDLATSLLETAKSKGVALMLPTDVVAADKFAADANSKIVPASSIPDGWMGLDIGPDSIRTFGEALDSTKTVIWNGPMGVFEFDKFAVGTETIVKKLADLSSGKGVITIIGGSDSVAAVEKVGLADKMSHISTGGGASLELLEGKSLPGVLALDDA